MLVRNILLIGLLSFLIGCRSKEEPPREFKVEAVMPTQGMLNTLQRKMHNIDWVSYVHTDRIEPKNAYVGYQMGVLIANWTICVLSKDEEAMARVSTNWFTFARDIDINDDLILLRIRDKVRGWDEALKNPNDENYRKIKRSISEIKNELTEYYADNNNGTVLKQIGFAVWLELMYIGVEAMMDNYEESVTTVLNRNKDANYFAANLAEDGNLEYAAKFVEELSSMLNLSDGKTMSLEELELLRDKILAFRALYIN